MSNIIKYLNEKATDVNADLENGFIYATSDDTDNTDNYFQACLVERKDGNGFKKEIDSSDCGWDWGICGDYNDSINANTENHLNDFLKLARKCGVRVS